MNPTLAVLCAWLLFGGSHLLLGSPPLRDALVRRLGERAFAAAYTVVAAASLLLLAAAVARYGGEGAPGPGLASVPIVRWAAAAVAFLGVALIVAGLMNYFRSPIAFLRRRLGANSPKAVVLRAPAGVERITRHPFFVGIAMLMGTHVLLATTLAGAAYFGGFVLLAVAGIALQDRKLRAQHGAIVAPYLAATSAVPFAALRRSGGGARERIWPLLAASLICAAVVLALHPFWRLGHGAPFAVATVIGGLYAVVRQARQAHSSKPSCPTAATTSPPR